MECCGFFARAEYSGDTVSIERESKGEDNCQVARSFSEAKSTVLFYVYRTILFIGTKC